MLLEYDVKGLYAAIEAFHLSTGVSISIMDGEYSVLGARNSGVRYCGLIQSTKAGRRRCINANRVLTEKCRKNKRTELRLCHAGLIEMAVPIITEGEVIGYILLGHIKPEEGLLSPEGSADVDGLKEAYGALTPFSADKIKAIATLAEMLARLMVHDGLIGIKKDPLLESVKSYTLAHLKDSPSVEDICLGAHVSRATLYSLLKDRTGETVKDYVNRLRLDRVKTLLTDTDMTVEEIAREVGLSGAAYLGRLFRRELGTSPLKYRKGGNR